MLILEKSMNNLDMNGARNLSVFLLPLNAQGKRLSSPVILRRITIFSIKQGDRTNSRFLGG